MRSGGATAGVHPRRRAASTPPPIQARWSHGAPRHLLSSRRWSVTRLGTSFHPRERYELWCASFERLLSNGERGTSSYGRCSIVIILLKQLRIVRTFHVQIRERPLFEAGDVVVLQHIHARHPQRELGHRRPARRHERGLHVAQHFLTTLRMDLIPGQSDHVEPPVEV